MACARSNHRKDGLRRPSRATRRSSSRPDPGHSAALRCVSKGAHPRRRPIDSASWKADRRTRRRPAAPRRFAQAARGVASRGVGAPARTARSVSRIVAADVKSAPYNWICRRVVSESAFKWPVDPIARGGMAAIYLAEDKRLGRPVILKAPREGEEELAPGLADMFQVASPRRRGVLAKLQNPSIVTIHELGKSTGAGSSACSTRGRDSRFATGSDELCEQEKDGSRGRASGSSAVEPRLDRGGTRVRARDATWSSRLPRRTTSSSANAARRR